MNHSAPIWFNNLSQIPAFHGNRCKSLAQRNDNRAIAAAARMYGLRNAGTAILNLLMPAQTSPWHTVRSTELRLYHLDSPLLMDIGSKQGGAAKNPRVGYRGRRATAAGGAAETLAAGATPRQRFATCKLSVVRPDGCRLTRDIVDVLKSYRAVRNVL